MKKGFGDARVRRLLASFGENKRDLRRRTGADGAVTMGEELKK